MSPSKTHPVNQRPRGVLIVDDEECVRKVLHAWLRKEGFSVWLAADGRTALDLYREHYETIDVALLDVCMPGLDGPQTLAALREITPQVRCCFMSGFLGDSSEKKLRDLGAVEVFEKPFRLDEVANALGDLAREATSVPNAPPWGDDRLLEPSDHGCAPQGAEHAS